MMIWFAAGLLYFAVTGRKTLVLSPEEEFALSRGEHGIPDDEGYGAMHVADVEGDAPATAAPDEPEPTAP
jgi:ethanolamine permease